MKASRILFGLCVWLLLEGCKSSTDIIYQPTELTLTVLNDLGVPQPGAQVRIFDNEKELDDFKIRGVLAQDQPARLTDANGQLVYTNLDEKLKYYFFITYRDRTRFLDLENFAKQFVVPGYLQRGARTSATIQLEKSDNIVVFYSLPLNESQLPASLYLDGDLVGTIDKTVTIAPTSPNNGNTFIFRLRAGTTSWYAQSSLGCIWTGQLTLGINDNFTTQELVTCESGAVTFYTEAANQSKLPIKITLSDGDEFIAPDQPQGLSNTEEPLSCFESGKGISGSRKSGEYTYIAKSKDNVCVWTGRVMVTNGSCSKIKLEACN
jgi:hypothetical protein